MDIIESFKYLVNNVCCYLFREMTVLNDFIEKLIACEVLSNDVPFIDAFEILVYFNDVGMVKFFKQLQLVLRVGVWSDCFVNNLESPFYI